MDRLSLNYAPNIQKNVILDFFTKYSSFRHLSHKFVDLLINPLLSAFNNFAIFLFSEAGTSSDPCSDTYPGPYAFSEKCTSNLRDFVLSEGVKGRIGLYYDIHAYSQLYLVPYMFNQSVKPPDDDEIVRNHVNRSFH